MFPHRTTAGLALLGVLALALSWQVQSRASLASRESRRTYPPSPVRLAFEAQLDALAVTLDRLQLALERRKGPERRAAFRAARRAYKGAECLLAVWGPALALQLNGPLPEESEDRPAGPLGAPAGFQILESALFGGDSPGPDSLQATVRAMRSNVREFRRLTAYINLGAVPVLDALRLELARVSAVGLAGVDADLSGDAVLESATALEGGQSLVRAAAGSPGISGRPSPSNSWIELDSSLGRAAAYLRGHPRFDDLDRLTFIVAYANPAARAAATARALFPPPLKLRRFWRLEAATIFDAGAFDPLAYAPDDAPPSSPELVALGRRLFNDPRLSGPGSRSCAFCHNPSLAFADGRARSLLLIASRESGIGNRASGPNVVAPLPTPDSRLPIPDSRDALPGLVHRNTPTLLNAGYQPLLFTDARAGSLEAQATMVLKSPTEMGGSADQAAERLLQDSLYRQAFARAFRGRHDSTVTGRTIRFALAAYVRSLGGFESRFDRALRGEAGADSLSPAERRGFNLFMGKGRCGTCHFLPLFNGTLPPDFVSSEPEIIGVTERPGSRRARLDPDPGRGGVDHEPAHRGAFKVPTLRNIALTAPYMHNGAFATLEQVIDFYNRGGGAGSGARVPGQTLPARPLHLTPRDRSDLIAFLGSLTDTTAAK